MSLPIIHTLKHEHRVIEQALRALEGICFRLACKEKIPTEALAEVVDFSSRFVDTYHHTKEENYLFPRMEKHGIVREGGPLGSIEVEHEVERKLITELNIGVQGLKTESDVSRQVFIEAARKFIAHLTSHMQQEEAILFRLAEELLDPVDGESLAKDFRQMEKEFGQITVKRYENLATSLEEKWAL